ncbi:hypothetical protein CRG98_041256 [Punica granatum]|uniref:Uncharacterized protein n=1 Tax=Punica granatum TaxID=22663 RepID=A0A2I0I2W9_PUNGR|nr:hypothetical protein CRG98_041256 [Punica granatum]
MYLRGKKRKILKRLFSHGQRLKIDDENRRRFKIFVSSIVSKQAGSETEPVHSIRDPSIAARFLEVDKAHNFSAQRSAFPELAEGGREIMRKEEDPVRRLRDRLPKPVEVGVGTALPFSLLLEEVCPSASEESVLVGLRLSC